MKKLDYLLIALCLIIDIVLLILPGCPFDIYAFFIWLAVIAIFVVCMHYIKRKKQQRNKTSVKHLPEHYLSA